MPSFLSIYSSGIFFSAIPHIYGSPDTIIGMHTIWLCIYFYFKFIKIKKSLLNKAQNNIGTMLDLHISKYYCACQLQRTITEGTTMKVKEEAITKTKWNFIKKNKQKEKLKNMCMKDGSNNSNIY